MEFPNHLHPDQSTRAGRMLAAGDVRITVTNLETDKHITVRFKAILDNRQRVRPSEDRNWIRVPLDEATHVFLEVPSTNGGDYPDKIGSFYPRTGRFFIDSNADPERVEAAIMAAHYLTAPDFLPEEDFDWLDDFEFQEESYCGVCGHALTDPESIDLGIGPECNRKATRSQHQVKSKSSKVPANEKPLIAEILSAIQDLSDAGQQKVLRELEMWHRK